MLTDCNNSGCVIGSLISLEKKYKGKFRRGFARLACTLLDYDSAFDRHFNSLNVQFSIACTCSFTYAWIDKHSFWFIPEILKYKARHQQFETNLERVVQQAFPTVRWS